MVPNNSSQNKSSDNIEEDSNKVKSPSAATPHHKLDKDKLAKIRETIRVELARIRLDAEKKHESKDANIDTPETRKRKLPISKIVWDPEIDGGDRAPKTEEASSRKVVLKPPTSAADDKRERKVLRKCQLCNRSTANMKNHLAFSHLKENWWVVLADQTCWKCRDYHPFWKIAQCEGTYMPLAHKSALLCRHREFIEHTMEEIVSPQELVGIVRNMRLCDSSLSDFSELVIS